MRRLLSRHPLRRQFTRPAAGSAQYRNNRFSRTTNLFLCGFVCPLLELVFLFSRLASGVRCCCRGAPSRTERFGFASCSCIVVTSFVPDASGAEHSESGHDDSKTNIKVKVRTRELTIFHRAVISVNYIPLRITLVVFAAAVMRVAVALTIVIDIPIDVIRPHVGVRSASDAPTIFVPRRFARVLHFSAGFRDVAEATHGRLHGSHTRAGEAPKSQVEATTSSRSPARRPTDVRRPCFGTASPQKDKNAHVQEARRRGQKGEKKPPV